jgi:glycosyltransferase involved in cell wall biosynthesis
LKSDLGRDDFFCIIIGKGAALASLRSQVVDLGLCDHVRLTGYVPDDELLRYLSTADIFVDPDPSNSFNDRSTMIKMMEYMALERPIVAFDLPEHRVTAGDASLYAQPNDERDFAHKLATLMDDAPLRARMGAYGRKRVVECLGWPMQAKLLLAAYATLFARPSGDGVGIEGADEQLVAAEKSVGIV